MGNEQSQAGIQYGECIENDIRVSWSQVKPSERVESREGHACAVVGDKLYIFGGVVQTSDSEGEESKESNDIIAFDAGKHCSETLNVTGDAPCSRSAASMSAVGHNLYLFGGLSKKYGWLEDFYCFNTELSKWQILSPSGHGPCPRDKLTAAVVDNQIYMFGGFGPQNDAFPDQGIVTNESDDGVQAEINPQGDGVEFGWFNDVYKYDTVNNTWCQLLENSLNGPESVPTPRAAHAMCAIGKDLIVFGGKDQQARQNDLYKFDTIKASWEKLKAKGRQPEPRSFHTLTSLGSRAVVLGGRGRDNQHFADIHIFDNATMEWLQPSVAGISPTERASHSATVVGRHLVVYGGSKDFDPETMQCQTFLSDIQTMSTSELLSGRSIMTSENGENHRKDAAQSTQ